MAVSTIIHDDEVFSEADLVEDGLDAYSSHPTTYVQMKAWRIDNGPLRQWQVGDGPLPREVVDALSDPHVIKKAFNAQFERVQALRVLKIPTPYSGWRCTQVRAYSQSFSGGLEDVAEQLRLPPEYHKDREGKRLMKMFMRPQKVTKNQPHRIRNAETDPDDWEKYLAYNRQDVIAEEAVERRLVPYPMLDSEWELYEIDQQINDRGMPVDMLLVRHGLELANKRSDELQAAIQSLTGVENPNSVPQIKPWLQERGYWFDDMRADTVEKVFKAETAARKHSGTPRLTDDAYEVLRLRQWAARSSTDKFEKLLSWVGPGDRARFMFQFGGASRTNRWAGRGPQPQNLPRTPKVMEDEHGDKAAAVAAIIKGGTEADLQTWLDEQEAEAARKGERDTVDREILEPLVGSVRSAFQAPEGHILDICDLSAIESRVIGWLTGCVRLNRVFENDLDPYKDFGTELYNKPYHLITKKERGDSKPGMLGCGFRLSGGDLFEGKRTGLWGYAENMGVDLAREEAHRQVAVFREKYPEIPQFWYALEKASCDCVETGRPQRLGMVRFEMMRPYLTALLPSGRRLFYQYPEVAKFEAISKRGNPYIRRQLSYMAKHQKTKKWIRQESHGGLLIENLVQAIARDVLKVGIMRAHDEGFNVIAHVHDEIITMRPHGENRLTLDLLRCCMRWPIHWAPGLLLNAAGFSATIYRKD